MHRNADDVPNVNADDLQRLCNAIPMPCYADAFKRRCRARRQRRCNTLRLPCQDDALNADAVLNVNADVLQRRCPPRRCIETPMPCPISTPMPCNAGACCDEASKCRCRAQRQRQCPATPMQCNAGAQNGDASKHRCRAQRQR
jgi:hypothetical protein